jgi:hypothetical protein
MKSMAVLMALLVMTGALAGCSEKKKSNQVIEEVPGEIDQNTVDELDALVTEKYPRAFGFPGQTMPGEALLESKLIYLNGTVAQGTAAASAETPNDDGPNDFGGAVETFDISEHVPVGQPVELRVKLKWYGDPGASADLDIFANVPGTHDSYSAGRNDESWNWAIITKFRVINTVNTGDQPFEIGYQVTNGKVLVSEGMKYSLAVEFWFPPNVLAPGVPYRISIPPSAAGLFFLSEPVIGDEHIQSEILLIDPDGLLRAHFVHDDIVTETRFVSIVKAGDYILYSPTMHGGFLRVEADVPNPTANATILPLVVTEVPIDQSGAIAAPAGAGTFDPGTGQKFPLDITPYIRTSDSGAGLSGSLALNFTSTAGWIATLEVQGSAQSDADGAAGRLGSPATLQRNRGNLATGPVSYTLSGSAAGPAAVAAGVEIGAIVTTYG